MSYCQMFSVALKVRGFYRYSKIFLKMFSGQRPGVSFCKEQHSYHTGRPFYMTHLISVSLPDEKSYPVPKKIFYV